jgi:hypothetical protein
MGVAYAEQLKQDGIAKGAGRLAVDFGTGFFAGLGATTVGKIGKVGKVADEVTEASRTRFIAGSDGVVTDLKGSSDAITLGRGPAYIHDAQRSGARAFHMPDEVWNAMTQRTDRFGGYGENSEVWIRNERFLDEAVARGREIRLASDPYDPANAGSFFEREIAYLRSKGYRPVGNRMVRGE